MALFSISLTLYPHLLLEKKSDRASKKTAQLSGPAAPSTAIPASYTFGLKSFPTFLICFCSPLFLKTSVSKADLRAYFGFYASTCTNKCFGNNSIVIHFYYNVGPNYVSPPKLGILKNHVHAHLQAYIQLFKCKSSFWRDVQITNIELKHEKCAQSSTFLKSYVTNINKTLKRLTLSGFSFGSFLEHGF